MDLIFTDTPGVVASNAGNPIVISDYCYLSAIIRAKEAVSDVYLFIYFFFCKIY